MATIDDVSRLARRLPEVTEGERHGNRTWFVAGPILAVRVEDLGEKEAVLAAHPADFFTIPHFDGYSAVLIQLPKVPEQALREAVTDGRPGAFRRGARCQLSHQTGHPAGQGLTCGSSAST